LCINHKKERKRIMKIAVIGTGAMGMLFGACLADGGEDVTMVTAGRKETEEAIRLHGIHMLWDEKDIYVKVRTAMAGSLHEQFDLVILFTKAQDSAAVLEKCRDMTGSDTYLMTLQNGLGNVERAGKFVPHDHIICGALTMPGSVTGPGEIKTMGTDRKAYIGMADEKDCTFLHEVCGVMNACGLTAEITDDVYSVIWGKAALNSGFNPVSALTRLPQSRFCEVGDGEKLVFDIMEETLGLAEKLGVNVDREAAFARARTIMVTHKGHFPSMAQDIMNGRRTEIDCLNGEIVRRARAAGYPVPRNETVCTLVRLLERNF